MQTVLNNLPEKQTIHSLSNDKKCQPDPNCVPPIIAKIVVKKYLNPDATLYTQLRIVSATRFEKMPWQQAFPGNGLKCPRAFSASKQIHLIPGRTVVIPCNTHATLKGHNGPLEKMLDAL